MRQCSDAGVVFFILLSRRWAKKLKMGAKHESFLMSSVGLHFLCLDGPNRFVIVAVSLNGGVHKQRAPALLNQDGISLWFYSLNSLFVHLFNCVCVLGCVFNVTVSRRSVHMARCFPPYSEELLGLRLGRAFGGRGGFGFSREDAHNVLESFTYLSSESVGVLRCRKIKC